MTSNSNEKRVNILEGRQPQPDFVPARWLTRAEAEPLEEIEMQRQFANLEEVEKEEAEILRTGSEPAWIVAIQRDRRAAYLRKKAGTKIQGCTGCRKCFENKGGQCVLNNQ